MKRSFRKFVGLMMIFTMLVGTTAVAAPAANASESDTDIRFGTCATDNNAQREGYVQKENGKQPFATVVAPRINIKTIRVYPLYLIPNDNNPKYGLVYYEKNQVGGQFMGIDITPQMKANLDNAVTKEGYTQLGYYYEVVIEYPGTYTMGRLEVKEPAGFESHSVNPYQIFTYSFLVPLSSPRLLFNGAFWYTYQGRRLSQMFNASSLFTE